MGTTFTDGVAATSSGVVLYPNDSFLERYYDGVNRNLSDPSTSRRIPDSMKFKELIGVEAHIWESLLRCTGFQSNFGQAEATITLVADQRFYRLPGNFRQFVAFEKRTDGDPTQVEMILRTVATYDVGPGVQILSAEEGMKITPPPDEAAAGDWTLVYQKGPVALHRGTVYTLSGVTLTGTGVVPTDGGNLVPMTDYYNGSLIRVYSGSTGIPQTAQITDFAMSGSRPVFTLREALSPTPTGTLLYEICPLLPQRLDGLYAIEVAIALAGRRGTWKKRAGLMEDRTALWSACKQHFESNTMDRASQRISVPVVNEVDPYA